MSSTCAVLLSLLAMLCILCRCDAAGDADDDGVLGGAGVVEPVVPGSCFTAALLTTAVSCDDEDDDAADGDGMAASG